MLYKFISVLLYSNFMFDMKYFIKYLSNLAIMKQPFTNNFFHFHLNWQLVSMSRCFFAIYKKCLFFSTFSDVPPKIK